MYHAFVITVFLEAYLEHLAARVCDLPLRVVVRFLPPKPAENIDEVILQHVSSFQIPEQLAVQQCSSLL